nr:substrate-binding domain-containing protein [Holophaga foetida]
MVLVALFLLVCSTSSAQSPAATHLVAEGGECLMYSMALWGDALRARAPEFSLEVRTGGEAKAMRDLGEGTVQMAMLARDATADELGFFRNRWGYLPTRIALAMDALVLAVHRDNPIQAIHVEEADAIYSEDRTMGWPRDILKWGDLEGCGAKWAQRPITRYGRTLDSSVTGLVLMYFPEQKILRMPIQLLPDGMAMAETLAADPNGICAANLVENFASIKFLAMYPAGSRTAVFPTQEAVSSGEYPYSRNLYVYVNKPPRRDMDPLLKQFLSFALSREGQEVVKAVGQAPLGRDLRILNLTKLSKSSVSDLLRVR